MILLLEIGSSPTIELLQIPESIGLLFFGVLLVGLAVTLRAVAARVEKSKIEKETVSLAGKQNG